MVVVELLPRHAGQVGKDFGHNNKDGTRLINFNTFPSEVDDDDDGRGLNADTLQWRPIRSKSPGRQAIEPDEPGNTEPVCAHTHH